MLVCSTFGILTMMTTRFLLGEKLILGFVSVVVVLIPMATHTLPCYNNMRYYKVVTQND